MIYHNTPYIVHPMMKNGVTSIETNVIWDIFYKNPKIVENQVWVIL